MIDQLMQLVSVIVPVYNRASTVVATLDSVKSSLHWPIELIVVDDGSTDNSLAVIKKYQSDNQSERFSIIVISQENGGAPKAQNHGLRQSSGKYIQFLDSDDLIDETKIGVQIGLMQKEGSDGCVCEFRVDYVPCDKDSYVVRTG